MNSNDSRPPPPFRRIVHRCSCLECNRELCVRLHLQVRAKKLIRIFTKLTTQQRRRIYTLGKLKAMVANIKELQLQSSSSCNADDAETEDESHHAYHRIHLKVAMKKLEHSALAMCSYLTAATATAAAKSEYVSSSSSSSLSLAEIQALRKVAKTTYTEISNFVEMANLRAIEECGTSFMIVRDGVIMDGGGGDDGDDASSDPLDDIERAKLITCPPCTSRPDSKCSVCLCYGDNETLMVPLKCTHEFHLECLLPWTETQSTCPLCRTKIECDSMAAATAEDRLHRLKRRKIENDKI